MLISCPECANMVSDKAVACPKCGFPLQMVNLSIPESKQNKAGRKPHGTKKYKKLPNGFGSIQKLSGPRSHPYAAYPPTVEFSLTGSPVRQPALGYYKDWHAAYEALATYNKLTDQEREENAKKYSRQTITFAGLYELYYADRFKKEIAEGRKSSMMNSMAAAFKNCSALHSLSYSTLRKNEFQNVIEECPLKYSSKELIIILYKQMAKFALENDYIEKDYSQFAYIDIEDDDEGGEPFTEEDIQKLWADSEDPVTKIILIMIYSGFRIAAFQNMQLNFEEGYFLGGVKTRKSKNRTVPFHSKIVPLLSADTFNGFVAWRFREKFFYAKLRQLGLSHTADGIKHTPHDTRHTFSWLCDHYSVDDVTKHLLMGHALKGDAETMKYSHRTFKELQQAIEQIDDPKFLKNES